MTNRRKYSNNHTTKVIKTVTTLLPCEPCADLKYTPAFVEAMMVTNKIPATQVQAWWHMRGHTINKR